MSSDSPVDEVRQIQRIQRILVPLDGSEPSLRALDLAVTVAQGLGATLSLVSVLEVSEESTRGEGLAAQTNRQFKEQIEEDVLIPAAARLPADGPPAETSLLYGSIVDALLEAAEAGDVGMVIMGKTGKGAIRSLIEGSVSREMARRCAVPVMVVA